MTQMKVLPKKLEEEIFAAAIPLLEKGRPNYDIPHTIAVVHWMKELIAKENGNPRVLVSAAYLHDIGTTGVYPAGMNMQKMSDKIRKAIHMKVGADEAVKILINFSEFTVQERLEIIHLVGMHDDLEKIHSHNEQLLFEADTLGQIDRERLKPTSDKEGGMYFLNEIVAKERVPLFRTQTGKRALAYLLPIAYAYWGERMPEHVRVS